VVRIRGGTLTARAAILALTLGTVALALALPLKIYLAQGAQIAGLAAQNRAAAAKVAALRAQAHAWTTPGYVEQQARNRLHFVLPGETTYLVLGGPVGGSGASGVTPRQPPASTRPWYGQLWQTVVAAGSPPRAVRTGHGR